MELDPEIRGPGGLLLPPPLRIVDHVLRSVKLYIDENYEIPALIVMSHADLATLREETQSGTEPVPVQLQFMLRRARLDFQGSRFLPERVWFLMSSERSIELALQAGHPMAGMLKYER